MTKGYDMARLMALLSIVAVCTTGCTPAYRVHVNGYAEHPEPVSRNAAIYVVTDPNAQNPIFQKEIKSKIETVLRGYGYVPTADEGTAAYYLDFQVGMNSETVTGYAPVHGMYGGYSYGLYRGYGFGYTTYLPYHDTQYDQWLIMRLLASNRDDPPARNVVWVGEAMTRTSEVELREAINYLLVACIEYLGVDTGGRVTLVIKEDDPRIIDMITGTQTAIPK